ncbi:hypothetical protein SAMN05216376_102148 [Mameliella alba]|nr:hypothetical protein SAMN05216376_102148 [Mameliella alba]
MARTFFSRRLGGAAAGEDTTRGTPRAPDEKVGEVIRLTQEPQPHEATHCTIRGMGKAHGLSPHRWRQFKLPNDRAFAGKLHDVVGLYVAPPAHAVVLSVDEKSQVQALDRTQPGLPLKKGRGPTMTHDHALRGAQSARRIDHRPEHAAPPASGVHPVPEPDRTGRHQGQGHPRRPRQLLYPQTFQSAGLAGTASALDVPLHPDIVILAERGGGVLCQTNPAQTQARRVPLGHRPAGRNQPLHRRIQPWR